MSKLLRAGFYHRRKTILLWAALLFSLAYGIFYMAICLVANSIEDGFFLIAMFLMMGIYISLSTGNECSNGVIRNKIISGHTKWTVFMSEMILNSLVCVFTMLLFLFPLTIAGCRMLFPDLPAGMLIYTLLGLMLVSVCYAAIFTLISFLIKSKAVGSIVCILLTAAVMACAYYCESALSQIEYITVSDEASPVEENIPNPNYVDGTARSVLKAADCILPQGQTDGYLLYLSLLHKNVNAPIEEQKIDIHFEDYTNISAYPLCSLALSVFAVGIGWITVRKRDLK